MSLPDSGPQPRVVTVVQARMLSTRLPNKVMLPLAGEPLLVRMVERVQASGLAGVIVVATTTDPADDAIVRLCEERGLNVFRGDQDDLLDRHYQAARAYGAEAVVKIPSDCPLIDPAVIDLVLGRYLDHAAEVDFVSNLHPATYPDGNDVEIMSMSTLATAWREATRHMEREHTTPYIWEHPDRFRIDNVRWPAGLDYSMTHRWTIDYPEDYDFISAVYDALHPQNPLFTLEQILAYLADNPQVAALNAEYAGVNWYRHHLDELTTVSAEQTRQEQRVPSED